MPQRTTNVKNYDATGWLWKVGRWFVFLFFHFNAFYLFSPICVFHKCLKGTCNIHETKGRADGIIFQSKETGWGPAEEEFPCGAWREGPSDDLHLPDGTLGRF